MKPGLSRDENVLFNKSHAEKRKRGGKLKREKKQWNIEKNNDG